MTLCISSDTKDIPYEFLVLIKNIFKVNCNKYIADNPRIVNKWNKYLKENLPYSNYENLTFQKIVSAVANTLVISDDESGYQLRVSNKIYMDTNFNISILAKLLNFGCIKLSGTHIFTNVFLHIKQNINDYYLMFMLEKKNERIFI